MDTAADPRHRYCEQIRRYLKRAGRPVRREVVAGSLADGSWRKIAWAQDLEDNAYYHWHRPTRWGRVDGPDGQDGVWLGVYGGDR